MNENISQYSTCFAFSGYFCYYNSIYTLAIGFNINSFHGGGRSQIDIFYS